MSLHIYDDLEQGTDAWLEARRGMVTASVVGQLLTATGKPARNDYSRRLTLSLVAERITGYIEPVFVTDDMLRGTLDEPIARDIYSGHYEQATEVGFMVRDFGGFKIGYSPDGLVGDDGLIEIKSPRAKEHIRTVLADEVPDRYMPQVQCGLLVSGRQWCDYVSYHGGQPMWRKRVYADPKWHEAIVEAVATFEQVAEEMTHNYATATEGLPATERRFDLDEIKVA